MSLVVYTLMPLGYWLIAPGFDELLVVFEVGPFHALSLLSISAQTIPKSDRE